MAHCDGTMSSGTSPVLPSMEVTPPPRAAAAAAAAVAAAAEMVAW